MRSTDGSTGRLHLVVRDVERIVLGPWPLRPALTMIAILALNFYAVNSRFDIGRQTLLEAWQTAFPQALSVAGLAAVIVWASKRIASSRSTTGLSRGWYISTVLIAGITSGVQAYAIRAGYDIADMQWRGCLIYVLRMTIAVIAVHALLGVNDARLFAQIQRTEAALDEVREQQRAVIDAEERVRGSVARFLHDTVQAGIVAISLQLRAVTSRAPAELQAQLGSLVEELEEVRRVDVRAASRRLSPDLATVGLKHALHESVATYAQAMRIDVHIDDSLEIWSHPGHGADRQSLAVYRIVEQAVLNAAVHGQAAQVWVSVTRAGNVIEVRIDDDGVGLPEAVTRGTGSSLVSAWTTLIGGTWSLQPREPRGATLRAVFPITPSLATPS